jgi:hypothetical protein
MFCIGFYLYRTRRVCGLHMPAIKGSTFIIEVLRTIATWTLDTKQLFQAQAHILNRSPSPYPIYLSTLQMFIHITNIIFRIYASIDRGQGFTCQAAQDLSYYVALNILHYTYVSTYTIRTFMLVFLQIID